MAIASFIGAQSCILLAPFGKQTEQRITQPASRRRLGESLAITMTSAPIVMCIAFGGLLQRL
jgi:hypothetical protein